MWLLFLGLALFGILCFVGNILGATIKTLGPIIGVIIIILLIFVIGEYYRNQNNHKEIKKNWIESTE